MGTVQLAVSPQSKITPGDVVGNHSRLAINQVDLEYLGISTMIILGISTILVDQPTARRPKVEHLTVTPELYSRLSKSAMVGY